MANLIKIYPSSGESSAVLYSDADSESTPLATVSKGMIYTKVGSTSKYFQIAYDNSKEDIASGGTAMTGTVIAYPHTTMYKDKERNIVYGNVNNGTSIEILDDSDAKLFLITCLTTNGTLTGYVQTRFIKRDIDTTTRMIRSLNDGTSLGTVSGTGSSGLRVHSNKGGNSQVGGISEGSTVHILETSSGWHKVNVTTPLPGSWGTMYDVWVSASYITVENSNTVASVSKSDSVEVPKQTFISSTRYTPPEVTTVGANIETSGVSFGNNSYYTELSDRYMSVLATPFKYSVDIDPQYLNDEGTQYSANGYGRVMAKTIMSNPAILSIIPGRPVMFPNLFGVSAEDTLFEQLKGAAEGNQSVIDKITNDNAGAFSGKMYTFEATTTEYAEQVNIVCRALAVMMGIADKQVPLTTSTYGSFDYTYWTIRKKYDMQEAGAVVGGDPSIFKDFWDGLISSASRIAEAAISDTSYINFFLSGTGSSVSESMTNGSTDSPLSGILDGVSGISSSLNYFTGSGFDLSSQDPSEALASIFGSDSVGAGLLHLGENMLKGARMVLPKMLTGASYGKSYTCEIKAYSAYGDKESIFMNCAIVIGHLLPLIVPKQVSDNMYTYPYVIRGGQVGIFNTDLAIISDMSLTRGGADDTHYTVDGIPTEWTIQLTITPLIDNLMITSSKHPAMLAKNDGLLDYLANISGFDLISNNLTTKLELMTHLYTGRILDIPRSVEHKVTDTLYTKLNKYFTF